MTLKMNCNGKKIKYNSLIIKRKYKKINKKMFEFFKF